MDFVWNAEEIAKDMHEKALDGLEELARVEMLTEMKLETPVLHGTLRDNETIERRENSILIGTGKVTDDYAEKQHNDRSLHHKVGKAGFIEDPFNRLAVKAPEYIQKHTGL